MKKILIIDSKSYGVPLLKKCIENIGWQVTVLSVELQGKRRDFEIEEKIKIFLSQENYAAIFSFNYSVLIAEVCHQKCIPYISWIYDSPLVSLYSYTMVYDTNYVFLFDYIQYQELKIIGLQNVYYLPLASNTLEAGKLLDWQSRVYQTDVSFVGNLYNDTKNALYTKLQAVEPYTKGYLEALVDAQRLLYGSYILREGLSDSIVERLQEICPYAENNAEGVETANYIYADYFLARRVTQQERIEVLERLSKYYQVTLYSGSDVSTLSGVNLGGKVDYYDKMPIVFQESKVNLNITLKSIQSGIPLRCMDIMGAGGFLLTNYQMEMEEYFSAGEHYDYYGSMEELEDKTRFYLENENIRERIAFNGYKVVKENFNYEKQWNKIISIVWN